MAVRMDVENKIKISPNYSNIMDIQKISDVVKLLDEMADDVEWKCRGEAANIRYIADQLEIISGDHYYDLRSEEDEAI
jgi:hypothetical protein